MKDWSRQVKVSPPKGQCILTLSKPKQNPWGKKQGNRNQRQNKSPKNRSSATWLRTKQTLPMSECFFPDILPIFFLSHLRPLSKSTVCCRILEQLRCFCHNQHAVSAFPILLYYCNESKSRNTIISELIYYRRSYNKQSMPAVDACSFLLLLEASPS